ncbi:MAG TPA: protein kinase, partial [Gemmataceae bacterium]|nr:protein kinase [Gemmataceae bacterium]
MPAPATNDELLDLVRKSGVLDEKRLDAYLAKMASANAIPPQPLAFATQMVADGVLTHFQAEQFLQGKWRRFTIGRYKVLERLGAGGMGSVYLCEHKLMRRRVAVKVLPTAKADDPASLERFYREARAVAALDHPNIVRAYDIDQDEKLHFLVMEFVDGANFQEMIKRTGPMDVLRAAHYVRQAALGIQHAHETAGLVHRDIKPGNILVDRNGIVKILDMGLARFFHDTDDVLTKKYDENVLGTADYLAPEQALDSHGVDIRADIYSLGATFYFILTGKPPFAEGTVAQKLIWHQTRQPKSVRLLRPDVPEELAAVLEKAMSKDPSQRYQTPTEMAEALAPWTKTPIPPPPEAEMPQLSPAAMAGGPAGDASTRVGIADPPSGTRKQWQVSNGSPSSAAPTAQSIPAPAVAAPAVAPSAPAVNFRKSGPMPITAPTPPAPAAVPAPPPAGPAPVRPVAAIAPPTKPPARPILAPVPLRPAPAPVRPVAAPKPTAAPAEEEEPASWDKLVSDTADHRAQLDTAPKSSGRSTRPRPSANRLAVAPPPVSRRRFWIVVGVAAAAVVILIVAGVCLTIAFSSSARPAGREPLRVDPSGKGKFSSLKEALQHAHPGDRIVLAGDIQEDEVTVAKVENLTIESAPEHRAVWRAPDRTTTTLLNVNSAPGFHLKGVVFDGGASKTRALVAVFGSCPGLTIEDCDFNNIKVYGLVAASCDGAVGQPITLSNLHFNTTDAAQTGLYYNFVGLKETYQRPTAFVVKDLTFGPVGVHVQSSRPDLLDKV